MPARHFPVPQLTITLTYRVPAGTMFAIDSFPEDHRSPITDHADYIEVMPESLQDRIVACLNSGRQC